MHKWHISPPKYIMVNLKCNGSPTSPTQGQPYLIIYGIKGNHSDVPADVYDSPFIFENNKMVMETDLDMNGHIINGSSLKQNFFITGYYKKSQSSNRIYLNNVSCYQIIPFSCTLETINVYFD